MERSQLAGAQMLGAMRQPLSSFTASESFYRQSCFQSITRPCTDVWGLGEPGRLQGRKKRVFILEGLAQGSWVFGEIDCEHS